ncbi:MAG: DEAD/DEAH box helicase [Candidatus Bathyarchaeota archaeon]|uniref:DEAD/DEAH box helicase n=1 Tax=Candidatus Bathycorpusculum sp. TaxID=2994959 RepID=UPI002819BE16|nr:DEAD/DEAH box helicase [Candidatus Termiticorpusculum sp.]MCL2257959.1 DEAD/DEAH box helicase [Candidatus Termiticorpusculum sp.]MCL2291867.1 DEAD/DEAH box helicase [Candidatus Termiticorpusculum sp.]
MINEFLKNIKKSSSYKKQIVHLEELPAHSARFGDLEKPLPENLQKVLLHRKIQLYSHQAQAINEVRGGKNIVITTPTASGKTLAFNIPVLEALINCEKATALYIYPTKALSNDQLKVLRELEKECEIRAAANIYDGDTPQSQRASIRENSRIILTNPYGLHQYLPWHHLWRRFFQNLKFIVIDESHVYRGVFGSNVAMVIRRLLRICNFYHADPQIILSSATIANPKEHAKRLTGKDFTVVSEDGSPRGKKSFVFWNPPFIDTANTIRRSTHQETKDLMTLNVLQNLQTLCFTTSRQMAELITRWTKEELVTRSKSSNMVTAYRAGYLPQERREIENRLKNKNLIGVVSTNALELGIDIGSLDSVILSGYPGTVISAWQQAGRAGRSNTDALVTLVAFQNPLDQYFMKHPMDFFGRPHEQAIIDLHNRYISLGHIMCATSELPVTEGDKRFFPERFVESIQALEQEKLVSKTLRGWVYSGTARTTQVVSLENISNKTVTVLCNGNILETLSLNKAYEEAHAGAVLLHQGETYLCESLDLEHLIAKVKQENVNYYTEVLKDVDVAINETHEENFVGTKIGLGELSITEIYPMYITKTSDVVLKKTPLDLPPLSFSTIGLWFIVPEKVREEVETQGLDFNGGIHAVEHAMIALSPIFAMCDRWDIGGLSTALHSDTGEATIFIYDGFEGGIGISETLYSKLKLLWEKTLELIDTCECKEGCPSCIYSPKCGNENTPLDKKAASHILKALLKLCNTKDNKKKQKSVI